MSSFSLKTSSSCSFVETKDESPMEKAETIPHKVFNLNIACAARDETHYPLHKRLNILIDFLKAQKEKYGYNILCLQEIRPTGTISAFDLMRRFGDALSMQYVYNKVNPSKGSFIRVTYYDPSLFSVLDNIVHYTQNLKTPAFPHMFMTTHLGYIDQKDLESRVIIINAHAPVGPDMDKTTYWVKLFDHFNYQHKQNMKASCILVGDLNVFNEEKQMFKDYAKYLDTSLSFHPDITFVSFPHDVDTNGQMFRSAPDFMCVKFKGEDSLVKDKSTSCGSFIVNTEEEHLVETTSDGKEVKMRITDHFGLYIDVKYD